MRNNQVHDEIMLALGVASAIILGLFVILAAFMQIGKVRDRKKFDREWKQFGPNVEAYLPDDMKAAIPEIEDITVTGTQDLYHPKSRETLNN